MRSNDVMMIMVAMLCVNRINHNGESHDLCTQTTGESDPRTHSLLFGPLPFIAPYVVSFSFFLSVVVVVSK